MAEVPPAVADSGESPPYIPWKTFLNLLTKMEEGVPNRLDKSWLSKQAGGMHQPIMAAFRFFELTDSANRPQATLDDLAKNPDTRPERMRSLIEKSFAWALELGRSATHDELREAFKDHGVTGSTQNKAIRFFLSGASYAGVPLSPHFQMPREAGGNGSPSRATTSTRRRQARTLRPARTPPPTVNSDSGGDEITVRLRAGGTLTLKVNVGHFALSRHKTDREFVQKLMDALTAYEEQPPTTESASGPEEEATP